MPDPQSLQILLPVVAFTFLIIGLFRPIFGTISYFIIMFAKLGEAYPALGDIRIELIAAVVILVPRFFSASGMVKLFDFSNKVNRLTWGVFIVGLLSLLFSINIEFSWNADSGGYNLVKMFLFYSMLISSIRSVKDLRIIVLATILLTFWVSYEPVYNYLKGVGNSQLYGLVAKGNFGVAAGHVALANSLSQIIPITFYTFLATSKKLNKGIIIFILCFMVFGVIATKSRGGFIGLVSCAAGIVFLSQNKKRAIIYTIILLFALLPITGKDYINRISTIQDGISGGRSSSDRWEGLINGVDMLKKRPILGVGVGCYAYARSRYFNYFFYSHNLYGELLGELGFSSCVWFLWIFTIFKRLSFIKQGTDQNRDEERYLYLTATGIQVALFTRLILGNFSHCAFIWFWFCMAALAASIETLKNNKDINIVPIN
jgi:hypothetical protein